MKKEKEFNLSKKIEGFRKKHNYTTFKAIRVKFVKEFIKRVKEKEMKIIDPEGRKRWVVDVDEIDKLAGEKLR